MRLGRAKLPVSRWLARLTFTMKAHMELKRRRVYLVGAVLVEQNDEWTEARRYMGTEILAACRKAA